MSIDEEKTTTSTEQPGKAGEFVTYALADGLTSSQQEKYNEYLRLKEVFVGKKLNKMLWKLDIRLVPVFCLLYLLSFLDRGNVGNAKTAGLTVTIPMTSQQYNTALSVFYVFYIVFEVPSQMMLKKFGPRYWITTLTVLWGTAMSSMAAIKTYGDFVACRSFLGIFEAGLFPAANYTLSQWYSREELASRVSIFFCAASVAGGFSGILAYAISFLNGVHGLQGWRYIFLVEGVITVGVGLLCPFIVLDNVEKSGSWLDADEKQFLILRQQYAYGPVAPTETFSWAIVRNCFTDWQIWCQIVIYIVHGSIGYSISFTLPLIIKSLGFSTIEAYLVPVPIYFGACVVTYINSWWGDKRRSRYLHIAVPLFFASVGASICMATAGKKKQVAGNLVGLILVTLCSYSPVPSSVSWMANNAVGYKRVVAMGMLMGIGNTSGLVASNVFISTESPYYHTGYSVMIVFGICAVVSATFLRYKYAKINKERDAMTEEYIQANWTEEQLAHAGDRSPYFRYLV